MNWGNNYGRYSNAEFDALMDQARRKSISQKRADLMHQAEEIAMDEFAAIPIY